MEIIILLLIYILLIVIWAIASFFPFRDLHEYRFGRDATYIAEKIYIFWSLLVIILGFLGIIFG